MGHDTHDGLFHLIIDFSLKKQLLSAFKPCFFMYLSAKSGACLGPAPKA
jgi:hypothetical protein